MNDPRPLVLLGLMGGLFLAAMDATVLAIVMPAVVADLGGTHLYPWAFTVYIAAAAVFMPLLGALSDRHGRKRFFLVTMGIFAIGSMACGLAPDMPTFLAARILQGIGAGGMLSIPLALAATLYTGAERGKAIGRVMSVWGIAAVAGPLVGGAAVALLSWHWVFFINIPVGLAGAWVVARHHHEQVEPAVEGFRPWNAVLLIAGLGALMVAFDPQTPQRIPLGIAGALLLVAFGQMERRAARPLLPIALLSKRPVLSANAAAGLAAVAVFVPIVFLPLHIEGHFGDGRSVVAIFPLSVAWSGTSLLIGAHLHRFGNRGVAIAGLGVLAAGLAGAPILIAQGLAGVALAATVIGAGMGLSTPALLLMVQNAAPLSQMGAATASQTFLRNVGAAVGVVALGGFVPRIVPLPLDGLARGLLPAALVAALGLVVVALWGREA